MTTRANSLTDRVTKQTAVAGTRTWSMPSADLRTFLGGLGRLGYDSRALLAASGVSEAEAGDPDARIPCEVLGRIVSSAQQTHFTPNLALKVARITPIGAYPLLDYLVLTSETVEAGVRQLARYLRLIGGPVALNVIEDADPIRVEMPFGLAPFSVEFTATLMISHLRNETDGRFAVAGMSFSHQPDDVAEFERELGCRPHTAAPWNGVTISFDAWHLPLRRRDPVLRQMLEAQANQILAREPARTGLGGEVQRALMTRVAGGDTRVDALARELAMSGRTLQRRLAAEASHTSNCSRTRARPRPRS
jgi:hypothetical protein